MFCVGLLFVIIMNLEDEALVDSFLSSGGFLTLVEEDEDGNFIEVKPKNNDEGKKSTLSKSKLTNYNLK